MHMIKDHAHAPLSSAWPEVRWIAEPHSGTYSLFWSAPSYALTTLRTNGSDGQLNFEGSDALVHHFIAV